MSAHPARDVAGTPRTPLDLRRWRVFARARLRQGVRRARGAATPILEAAVGVSLAWLIAADLLHHPMPIFAPVATWVCLGFTQNRVPRKVAELGVGATAGVLIGEAFALAVPGSWWSIPMALVVAALFGRLLDRGDLVTMQSGVNAMVVLAMTGMSLGGTPGLRWVDAVVGAGVAFVIAVLLPRHPASRPKRYARASVEEFAAATALLSDGLKTGDLETLRDVAGELRALDQVISDWETSLKTATDIVRLNPALWGDRDTIDELNRLCRLLRRAHGALETLARQALGLTQQVGRMPVVGELTGDISRALTVLAGSVGGWTPPENAREQLLDVASRCRPADLLLDDWRPAALMSLVRALVVDLLRVTGLSVVDAREALPDHGRAADDVDDAAVRGHDDDAASAMWG